MRVAILIPLLFAASCGTSRPEASQEQVAQEEHRLLAPFTSGIEVGCDELIVEMTANFHVNVSRPAVNPKLHTVNRTDGDGYTETRWLNLLGDLPGAFVVTIGEPDRFEEGGYVRGRETRYTVVRGLVIRVFEATHEMTLDAEAKGNVVVLAGGKPEDVSEYSVQDGQVTKR